MSSDGDGITAMVGDGADDGRWCVCVKSAVVRGWKYVSLSSALGSKFWVGARNWHWIWEI